MPLPKELRKKIEDRLGQPVQYSRDCETLAQAIEDATGERLGVTTVKRLFGFAGEQSTPRGSTMDILAMYLGYRNLKDMASRLGDAADISMFTAVDEVEVATLDPGTQIQITYNPDRLIVMSYIGDGLFIVNESQGSKLRKGDKVRLSQLAKGFELLASEVMRNGESIGQYHSAKDGGITSIEVII